MVERGGFFRELRRRKVIRVAAAYAAVAWLLIDLADTIFPHLALPGWSVTLVIVLLAIGFPIALLLSWAYEITPEGVRRDRELPPGSVAQRLAGRRPNVVLVTALALAAGWFVLTRITSRPSAQGEPSIAVLPFLDMSADGNQAYFADGLSEEILNLLAGIPELKVSGRTSSFSFKERDVPIPEIGRTLGVAYVLEGSVRLVNGQLRVTAQLIETESGFEVWSDMWRGTLDDVFAIQDEIAAAITHELRLTLASSNPPAVTDVEAYRLYLEARTLTYGRTRDGLREARQLIDRALERQPDYPAALALSSTLWLLLSDDAPSGFGYIPSRVARDSARAEAQRALSLDPGNAEAHGAMGLLHYVSGDNASAQQHLRQALAINPGLTDASLVNVLSIAMSGKLREAVEESRRLAEREPLFLRNLSILVSYYRALGNLEEADRLARRILAEHPDQPQSWSDVASVLLDQGRDAEAVRVLEELRPFAWEEANYRIGEYAIAAAASNGTFEARAWIAQGREAEGLARVRARIDAAPDHTFAHAAYLDGLSLAARHQVLLDWIEQHWSGPEDLVASFRPVLTTGQVLAPLAVAQRATGRTPELAATLAYWERHLALLEDNGFANGAFRFAQACFHALSGQRELALQRLAEAIDRGYRDPLLGRTPAFESLRNDPDFRAQVERNRGLINAEREKLGLPGLVS